MMENKKVVHAVYIIGANLLEVVGCYENGKFARLEVIRKRALAFERLQGFVKKE